MKYLAILAFILCGNLLTVQAADLRPPFALPNAEVLPKGVRNISYKNIVGSANEKYNDQRQRALIAEPFFKELTFKYIIEGQVDPVDKGSIYQTMLAMGASEEDSLGVSTGQVNVEAHVHAPTFAMGLTDKWTLALAVPIVESSVNMDGAVLQKNSHLHSKFIEVLNQKGVPNKIVEFNEKMRVPVQTKLRDYGYQELRNEKSVKLGDIKLVSKYQLLNDPYQRLAFIGELTLPTGQDHSLYKAVDIASGDGQTDLGLGVQYDYLFKYNITLVAGSIYTVQFDDYNPERIPNQYTSRVSPDIDPSTKRSLGNIWITQLGGNYSYKAWTWSLGYGYQHKSPDRYDGNLFEKHRYDWMSYETEQEMHTMQFGLSFDTIDMFKNKEFPLPLGLYLNHTRVMAGRNVPIGPITSLDLAIFF